MEPPSVPCWGQADCAVGLTRGSRWPNEQSQEEVVASSWLCGLCWAALAVRW
jgi:hypothetical protein